MFPSRSIADLARHLARDAEAGLPPLSLQRPPAGPLLAGRRRRQCARPLALCPPVRTGHRQGRRRQMDRRRHGRAWRSARSHPAKSAPRRRSRSRATRPAASSACRNPTCRPVEATRRPRRPMAPERLAARRLWAMSRPIAGTHAAAYLAERGITDLAGTQGSLRFHPSCYHRRDDGTRTAFPAMIASVTDDAFTVQGLHRTWLDPDRPIKALIPDPRRAMGMLLGHGVRIGFDRGRAARSDRRRRRHRNHAFPATGAATHAGDRRPLRCPSRRPDPARDAAPPLYRHRSRRRRAPRFGTTGGPRPRRRNRGRAAPSRPRRFQR